VHNIKHASTKDRWLHIRKTLKFYLSKNNLCGGGLQSIIVTVHGSVSQESRSHLERHFLKRRDRFFDTLSCQRSDSASEGDEIGDQRNMSRIDSDTVGLEDSDDFSADAVSGSFDLGVMEVGVCTP
jgi:hypothetical protein